MPTYQNKWERERREIERLSIEIICKLKFEWNLCVKSVWTELTPPHNNRYEIQSHHFEIKSINDEVEIRYV